MNKHFSLITVILGVISLFFLAYYSVFLRADENPYCEIRVNTSFNLGQSSSTCGSYEPFCVPAYPISQAQKLTESCTTGSGTASATCYFEGAHIRYDWKESYTCIKVNALPRLQGNNQPPIPPQPASSTSPTTSNSPSPSPTPCAQPSNAGKIALLVIVEDEASHEEDYGCKTAQQLNKTLPFSLLGYDIREASAAQMNCKENDRFLECNDTYIATVGAGGDYILALTSHANGGTAANGVAHVSVIGGVNPFTTHELGHLMTLNDEYTFNGPDCRVPADSPNVISLQEKNGYSSDSDVLASHPDIPWRNYISTALQQGGKLGSPTATKNTTGLFRGGLCDSDQNRLWVPNNKSFMNGSGRGSLEIPPYHMAVLLRVLSGVSGITLDLPDRDGLFPCATPSAEVTSNPRQSPTPAATATACYTPTPISSS